MTHHLDHPATRCRTLTVRMFMAIVAACAAPGPLTAQDAAREVIGVVQELLDAIGHRDTAAYRSLVLPEVRNLIVFPERDGATHRWRTTEASLQSLGGDGPVLLERMWTPRVWLEGAIASVWAQYDFHQDGAFSHCGVDAFHLVHTVDGWRIGAVVYTVIRSQSDCPPSPLGPPNP